MKTNIKHALRYVCQTACWIGLLILGACISDDFVQPYPPESPQGPGLHIALQPGGSMLVNTRTAGVDELRENTIASADVFIFKSDETLLVHANDLNNNIVTVYSGTDWLKHFTEGETYTVYVLANYKGSATLSSITTLDALKAVVATDENIAYWEGMTLKNGKKYEDKTFLMDGHTKVTYDKLSASTENIYDISVNLYRAAVKVEMTLTISDELAQSFSANNLLVQVANYATATSAIAEGNPLNADQRAYQTTPHTESEPEDNFTTGFVVSKGTNDRVSGSKVRFYAYVNRWDDLIENETMLLIDVPGTLKKDETTETYDHNFYKVPLIHNSQDQIMQRNTFYQINATADMMGSTEIDEPVELKNVVFKTAEWKQANVPVGDGDSPTYLILSDYHKVIRNADGFDDLKFYSSSKITNIEFVKFDNQNAATTAGIDFIYPGNGTNIPAIYFVNKDGKRQEVDEDDPNDDNEWQSGWGGGHWENTEDKITLEWDRNVVEGEISLGSPNPVNVTKRYITLKVTNDDDISKYVVVEQYPLEYIQPIAGYYSYRDDFLSEGVTPEGEPCHWEMVFRKSGYSYDDRTPTSNGDFESKVYNQSNGRIYTYSFSETGNEYRPQMARSSEGTTNNNMYFVTITQTSENYKIAHPLLDKNGYTIGTDENTELVSPMFMLASRLGTVQPMSYTLAQQHCANYVEVTMEGEPLDDWRLPTKTELQIIEEYQTTARDVMDEVLALSYIGDISRYWGAGGYYQTRYANSSGSGEWTNNTNTRQNVWIRCIRDVKPDDEFYKAQQ